jgi:Na+/proline symporter
MNPTAKWLYVTNLHLCFAVSAAAGWSAHWLDASVVLLYLIATFWLGLRASRMLHGKPQTEEDYFLAGRSVPGWVNGVSYAVTLVNADVAPAYCGVTAVVGLPVAWFYVSRFGLALLLAAMLFSVRWHQLGICTGPEFFSLRFGGERSKWARIYTSAYNVCIGTIPWIGAGLLGVHMIFAPIVGIESKASTLLIVLPVMVSYVWISGFAGVLVNDVMQTAVILAANVCLMIAVLWEFGGPSQLAVAVESVLPDKAHEILSLTPVPGHPVMGPLVVAAWMLVSTIGIGGSVALEGQRLFSCKSPRSAATVGVWCEITLFAMLALLTLPTLAVLVHHPEMYSASPQVRETAYSLLLHEYLPPGLLGLALAALLAAVMSTVAGHINYGSQTLLNDVCRQFFPAISEQHSVLWGRLLTIAILLLSIAVMSFSNSLVGIAIVVAGLAGSALAFSWGQWWWWRANFWAWAAATIGGPLVYLTLSKLLPLWPWWYEQSSLSDAGKQGMDMLLAVIAMSCTTLLWIGVALATPPENLETLKKFYLQARPMGLWGPVQRAIAAEDEVCDYFDNRKLLMLPGTLVAILGAIWIALGTFSLSALAIGRYATAGWLVAAATPLALLFWILFRWHVGRMTDPSSPESASHIQ